MILVFLFVGFYNTLCTYLYMDLADAAVAQAQWDPSEILDKLKRDIDAHITAVRSEKLAELNALYEVQKL